MEELTTDTELLHRLAQEDPRAFQAIYSRYFRSLCRFTEDITGITEVAEDIVADTFIKLLQKKPLFDSLDHLRAHLYTTARNAALDWLKAQQRHERSHAEIRYLTPPAEADIERSLIRAEALRIVYAEIDNLPAGCAQVIRLSFIDGFSVPEIAARLCIAPQTVMNQKARGLGLLRTALIKNHLLTPALMLACIRLLADHSGIFEKIPTFS